MLIAAVPPLPEQLAAGDVCGEAGDGEGGQALRKALRRTRAELERAQAEIARLRACLAAESGHLPDRRPGDGEELVGTSGPIQRVLWRIAQVGPTDVTVLITGETGTGKELVASALWASSPRQNRPLIRVNCAALASTLIESELFGHEKGAFTGALSRRVGRFELADGGTIFLDEIGDLPPELQPKLLRVLETREFERIGSSKTQQVDVRIVAATNRDLGQAVAEGRFRADLYYRLRVFPIEIPPLRERREDIPLLIQYFLARSRRRLGKLVTTVPPDVMKSLEAHDWPGNVRELGNTIEQAVILSDEGTLALGDPVGWNENSRIKGEALADVDRLHIFRVLDRCGWRLKGEGNAAQRLGLKPSTLRSRMKKLGIERREGGTRPRNQCKAQLHERDNV
ncbi:MAG TPA: sigma-54 dependent transcriptional regulator [Candidatus Binatia bacterium]|nr:sigma-54 dependent transcriptional regulator [Candidatus Binatia bacterium]